MSTPVNIYARDEDVALRAPADFALLCPRDQRLAAGADGIFEATDRWTLRSASVDFEAQGLAQGHVVQLLGSTQTLRPPAELMAVDSASGGAVVLRRLGEAAGVGQPPAPPGGATGLEFLACTLGPQLDAAAASLARRLGLEPGGDAAADPDAMRDAVVLAVLGRQYRSLAAGDDAMAAKARACLDELEGLLASLAVRRGGDSGPVGSPLFSSRIER